MENAIISQGAHLEWCCSNAISNFCTTPGTWSVEWRWRCRLSRTRCTRCSNNTTPAPQPDCHENNMIASDKTKFGLNFSFSFFKIRISFFFKSPENAEMKRSARAAWREAPEPWRIRPVRSRPRSPRVRWETSLPSGCEPSARTWASLRGENDEPAWLFLSSQIRSNTIAKPSSEKAKADAQSGPVSDTSSGL